MGAQFLVVFVFQLFVVPCAMLIRYGIPRARQGLTRNPWAALNSVLILTASLAVMGMIGLLYLNVEHFAQLWLSNTSISLFLRPDLDDDGRAAILERVRRHPLVKSAALVAPQEGLRVLAERLGGDSSLLAGIEPDVLPHSIDFDVVVDYRKRLGDIAKTFRNIPGVEEVIYTERILDKVDQFFTLTQAVGVFFLALLGISFYLTIAHSTRLSLHARRDELEILDLVGATRGVIRSAFVVEGILIAGAGYLLALGLIAACYGVVTQGLGLNALTHTLQGQTVFLPWQALLAAFGVTLGLAALSSRQAVNRMLRELEA
jgi:cell division transport system permease protein